LDKASHPCPLIMPLALRILSETIFGMQPSAFMASLQLKRCSLTMISEDAPSQEA